MPATNILRGGCVCQCGRPAWISNEVLSDMSMLVWLGSLYIVTSAAMIAFNKYLIHEGRFPFAIPLVVAHSGFSSACALILFAVKPSMFPSLTSPTERVKIDRDLLVRNVLPIALLFSVQLVLSNTAYLHSSMAFLQMMKEANLVLVYSFSLLFAIEAFNWTRLKLIFLIMFATMLTIQGELNFSWTGFCLQGSGQFFESLKIVLQVILLSSAGKKLDVMTYVLLVMPLCFAALGLVLVFLIYVYPLEHIATPQLSDVIAWWPELAANACLAFALNLTIALFMQRSSAVGFILAGITKDAVIVAAGVLAMGEAISNTQTFGFVLQLSLIWLWSVMKIFPEKFDGGLMAGLAQLNTPYFENKSLLTPEPYERALETHRGYGSAEPEAEPSHGQQC